MITLPPDQHAAVIPWLNIRHVEARRDAMQPEREMAAYAATLADGLENILAQLAAEMDAETAERARLRAVVGEEGR